MKNFGIRVSGSGSQVPRFGFRASDIGCRVPGLGFVGFGFRGWDLLEIRDNEVGFGFWVLGFGFWVLGFGFWILGFGFWVLGFGVWGKGKEAEDVRDVEMRAGGREDERSNTGLWSGV